MNPNTINRSMPNIFGASCAMIRAMETIRGLLQRDLPKQPDLDSILVPDDTQMFQVILELSRAFNVLSSSLGRTALQKSNDRLRVEALELQPAIKDLAEETMKCNQFDSQVHHLKLKTRALVLAEKLQGAFARNMPGLWEAPDTLHEQTIRLGTPDHPRTRSFCHGAVLCQYGRASTASLNVPNNGIFLEPQWGFICKFCNLEVADYKSIRLSCNGSAVETSNLIASCHLAACNMDGLRAFYRCVVCCLDEKEADFVSASALEAHMKCHEVLPSVLEKRFSTGALAVQNAIDEFLGEARSNLSVSDTQKTEVQDTEHSLSQVEGIYTMPNTQFSESLGNMDSDNADRDFDVSPIGSPMSSHFQSLSSSPVNSPVKRTASPDRVSQPQVLPPTPELGGNAPPKLRSIATIAELDAVPISKLAELAGSPGKLSTSAELPPSEARSAVDRPGLYELDSDRTVVPGGWEG
ncbi:hypothetical protein FALBO_11406 [Fusarium albosuccineum]|uniref:C2H2-type domain-containing protein n=1 Tax=Fusarium albosuccineum TaxID=1237068 RepID=A0A8H4L5W2_9HYPO|nr:hypothetical protein FALBO_11406 [Fusarium albosuccineum]